MSDQLMTFDEWRALTPESRAKINAYGKEFEAIQARLTLAETLISALTHNGALKPAHMTDGGQAWRAWIGESKKRRKL